jgi:phosphoribosylanthranilate isomerase
MTLEMITGLVVAVFAAIAAAFGLVIHAAPAKRKRKPTSSAPKITQRHGRSSRTPGRATKEASNVQQTVNHMPDDDVDRELRTNWTRKVEVVDTACDWVKPIYGTDHDWDVLDRQTKKDILAHNKAWQANCQKETRASQ